jgi:hypothetical protein
MPRPKLNLRDFFWLAALVALALGWYCDRRALRREVLKLSEDLHDARVLWIDAQVNSAWRTDMGDVLWTVQQRNADGTRSPLAPREGQPGPPR